MAKASLLSAIPAVLAATATAAAVITPQQARSHVGETATVCGAISTASYRADLPFKPTFLNFGQPYPNQLLTAVILGPNRAKFGAPEAEFKGKRICITGYIRLWGERPQIVLSDPSQISH